MNNIIYISYEQAKDVHVKTIEKSGGGDYGILNLGLLSSVLEHIQNDDYYPTFEDKLTHLIWSINKNHSFSDGNKRLSITLGLQFLSLNGYLYCIKRFLVEMENISYHLASGLISKELLQNIIHSFLENEDDFSEELKLELFQTISSCEDE
ncbi:MAG: type II toxin-antitoxin system death-on-curing family toxin [Flavobacteriaceae bacterium]|nr:type II toxin-antitoxin system death-on-curing family toxin [Flavobacteriaceae bacterium]